MCQNTVAGAITLALCATVSCQRSAIALTPARQVAFIEELDSEISSLKLAVNSRGRAVAAEFLRALAF